MAKRKPLTPAQREMKQARDRAYRARKVAEAKRAGLPSSVGYGHAKRAGLPPVRRLRDAGALPPARRRRPAKVRRTVQLGGGAEVHTTGSMAEAKRLVKGAADKGQAITIRGTFRVDTGWRRLTLDGTGAGGDFISGLAAGVSEAGSDQPGRAAIGRTDQPNNRQGRAGAPGVDVKIGGAGVPADEVWRAWLAFDGDWWAFLAAWAEAEAEDGSP